MFLNIDSHTKLRDFNYHITSAGWYFRGFQFTKNKTPPLLR